MAVGVSDALYILQHALTPIPGEGANHPTPRAQSHANECKEGRDANPQPQERNPTPTSARRGEMLTPTPRAQFHPNECGTNSPKRMRKSRGPSTHPCTQPITTISPAPHLDLEAKNAQHTSDSAIKEKKGRTIVSNKQNLENKAP